MGSIGRPRSWQVPLARRRQRRPPSLAAGRGRRRQQADRPDALPHRRCTARKPPFFRPVRNGQYGPPTMRLLVARCEVLYTGRLTARLPEAVRLLMFKADGSFLVHDDAGGYRPLNWMTPPTVVEEEPDLLDHRRRRHPVQ